VRKQAGTILNDGINKYFYLFYVVFMASVLEMITTKYQGLAFFIFHDAVSIENA
jgi:hypothetical protein